MNPRPDPWNILLLVGSLLAFLISSMGALGTLILGFVGYFVESSTAGTSVWVLTGTFVGLATLSLPSGWVAFQGLQGKELVLLRPTTRLILITLVSLPIVLIVGTLAFQANVLPSLLGPPAHFFAALLPVIALVVMVLRRSPQISQRRAWAHFMAGVWISPITALVLEILAAIPFLLIVIAGINARLGPEFLPQLLNNPTLMPDGDALESLLEVISQPRYILLLIVYLGLLVPLLEEAVKAIGLLPLLRGQTSVAHGFLGGVLAGAGYGLFEALYLGQPGPGWAALMIARGGATMMHMLTTGFTGVGIAKSRVSGRWSNMLRYYLYATGLHALWNLAAVLMGLGMAGETIPGVELPTPVGIGLTYGGGLVLIGLSVLAYRRLRVLSRPEPEQDPNNGSEVDGSPDVPSI